MLFASLLLAATTAAAPLAAQADPNVASAKSGLMVVKGYVLKSVDQVPQDLFSFKPTPEVRSMGQLFGHIADANFMICSMASDQKPTMADVEKTRTTKADLKAALEASFAYCEAAFDALTTAAKASQTVEKFFVPGAQTRLGVLTFNTAHDFEHYGNLVTYMRLKGMTPPSSAGGGM